MKSTSARGACLAILLASLVSRAWCEDVRLPSLVPMPPLSAVNNYSVSRAVAADALWGQAEPSPVPQFGDLPAPLNPSITGPEYMDAMKGDYEGYAPSGGPCGGCSGSACPGGHYAYANLLAMTHNKMGGFVTSVDAGTGNAAVFFTNSEFGNLWHGGFEVGAGWCLSGGCGTSCACNALELVYWGIFPATATAQARGDLNSTIDFGALDYNGASANVPFTDSALQRVQYSFNFNSVEANLVGNGMCGGPFGCGMCGCCMGRGGSRWGFGYVAGFRYINLSDRFLFSADPTGATINGEPQELNYVAASNNNLFGLQMGGGLSYCLTNRLTAYTIGKAGVYDNHITQLQQVYGTAGNATINTGALAAQDFLIRSSDDVLSVSGQVDVGGRWAINDCWSVNFGYRVLGLAGVAIAETQVRQNNFQDVAGISSIQRQGSFMMHGGYLGGVYCF